VSHSRVHYISDNSRSGCSTALCGWALLPQPRLRASPHHALYLAAIQSSCFMLHRPPCMPLHTTHRTNRLLVHMLAFHSRCGARVLASVWYSAQHEAVLQVPWLVHQTGSPRQGAPGQSRMGCQSETSNLPLVYYRLKFLSGFSPYRVWFLCHSVTVSSAVRMLSTAAF
jgi:hypothetical protein